MPKEQKGARKPWWTEMQIIRSRNLCVALYHALTHIAPGTSLALGRIGSHAVECHFGMVRSMLRGDDRLDRWLSAEVKAIMVSRLLAQLGQDPITRRSRVPISGVRVASTDVAAAFDRAWLVDAVLALANGEDEGEAAAAILQVLEGPLGSAVGQAPRQGRGSGTRHVFQPWLPVKAGYQRKP
jgi:hypothetical protein